MAYFPNSVMPKKLKRETSSEVDDSPLIYNARDHNIHHRDIRAIERLLLGGAEAGGPTGTFVGAATSGVAGNIMDLVSLAEDRLGRITDGGLLFQSSGTLESGEAPRIPTEAAKVTTSGPLLTTDAMINVGSTAGFPLSGYLTKFNSSLVATYCSDGVAPGGPDCTPPAVKYWEYQDFIGAGSAHQTNQELIRYTGKTDTSFLNCVRGVNGTTAQDLPAGSDALILCGKATIMFTPLFWALSTAKLAEFNQFYVSNDAMLTVLADVVEMGNKRFPGRSIADGFKVGYSLMVVGYFDDVSVAQVYSNG